MVRRLKPKQKHTCYHITVRTAQKAWLLADEKVKRAWENKLAELSRAYYVEVFAHAVLSNHVHIVLKVNFPKKNLKDLKERFTFLEGTLVSRRKWHDEWEDKTYKRFTDLSCFMRDLNQWLAAWHNKYAIQGKISSGHLWGRRFHSKVVGDDQYLLTVMSYADLNPVRAGIVARPGDFEFSTAGKLQRALDQGRKPGFPPVGFLRHVAPEKRAATYLVWLDFLAKCGQKPNVLPSLEGFAYAIEKEGIDVSQVQQQIKNKEPSNWSKPVFGNENFVKRILKREGWLPGSVHPQQKETPPPGQGIKSPLSVI